MLSYRRSKCRVTFLFKKPLLQKDSGTVEMWEYSDSSECYKTVILKHDLLFACPLISLCLEREGGCIWSSYLLGRQEHLVILKCHQMKIYATASTSFEYEMQRQSKADDCLFRVISESKGWIINNRLRFFSCCKLEVGWVLSFCFLIIYRISKAGCYKTPGRVKM